MRFISWVFTILIISSLTTQVARATSGACSGHGGVDCSAGSDWDGSVICYDGWRGSSVSYSAMQECDSGTKPCVYPHPIGCTTEQEYEEKVQACGSQHAINARRGMTGSTRGNSLIQQCNDAMTLCRNQIDLNKLYLRLYYQCLDPDQYSSTESSVKSKVIDQDMECRKSFGNFAKAGSGAGTCTCVNGYSFDNKKDKQCVPSNQAPIENVTTRNIQGVLGGHISTTQSNCPDFSARDYTGKCKCNEGTFALSDQCIVGLDYCLSKYGNEAVWDPYQKACGCQNGSMMDPATNLCISKTTLCWNKLGNQASINSDGICVCNQGATIDTNGKCESIIVINQRKSSSSNNISSSNGQTSTTPPTQATTNVQKKFASTTKRTNIRQQASASSKVIGVTTPKIQYEVLSQTSSWVKIQFGKTQGWIMKNLALIK